MRDRTRQDPVSRKQEKDCVLNLNDLHHQALPHILLIRIASCTHLQKNCKLAYVSVRIAFYAVFFAQALTFYHRQRRVTSRCPRGRDRVQLGSGHRQVSNHAFVDSPVSVADSLRIASITWI